MASSKQLHLSTLIKKTHQKLREDSKLMGTDEAWKNHCADKDLLREYSIAMHKLSEDHWEYNYNKPDNGAKSRIQWVYDYCIFYFFNEEYLKQRDREIKIAVKMNLSLDSNVENFDKVLKLLDVGSCYNPFKKFECFDVLAIDIAPAKEDVFYCDFLNLYVSSANNETFANSQIDELPQNSFHIVVFSLLLEYLPCPEQRLRCCTNAYKLLKYEGLLIIITPDSKHVGANAKYMKSWRYNLAHVGFSRIKYDKLPHIHCMAFRKSLHRDLADRWRRLQNEEFFDKMYIPQDFNDTTTTNLKNAEQTSFVDVELFNELPGCLE